MQRFRAILAGCGKKGRDWARLVSERSDVELVGLVDVREESARELAERQALSCPIYRELDAALAGTGADLVLDVTTPASHKRVVTTALRAGAHVFGEKPMATTLGDARAMIETAGATGRTYSVMQNRRYGEQIRTCKEWISDGLIGRVGFVCSDFFVAPHWGDFRDGMAHPLLVEMAIHTFDQARFITGSDPVSVYCREFNPHGSWFASGSSAICLFEMSDGSEFCYRGSWCAEGGSTSWQAAWRIVGSSGTILWNGDRAPYAEVATAGEHMSFGCRFRDHERIAPAGSWQGRTGHAGCLDEMFAALLAGRRAETDCRDNFLSVAMVLKAIESAEKGVRVTVES